jgi:hypothetical protein
MRYPEMASACRVSRSWLAAAGIATAIVLSGCASIRNAQPVAADIDGQRYEFGGSYDPSATALTITVNGEALLRGTFPPYTPTLNLSSKYRAGADVSAQCYFGSVLGSRHSKVGIIAGAIQGGLGKSSDKCTLTVNDKAAQEIYF